MFKIYIILICIINALEGKKIIVVPILKLTGKCKKR